MNRVWPPQFSSKPLVDGFSESRGSRLKRSPTPSAGPAKVRRKAGKAPDVFDTTWLFDDYDDLCAFVGWIDDVDSGLAGGLYPVDWLHPLSNKLYRLRIVPESEEILHTAQPFKSTLAWSLPLKFEVLA